MTSRVTLNVFSGRPNPTWLLSDDDERALTERLNGLQKPTERRPSGIYGGLGYRGVSIARDFNHPLGPLAVTIHEGVVDRQLAGHDLIDDTHIDSWLLKSMPTHLAPGVLDHVNAPLA